MSPIQTFKHEQMFFTATDSIWFMLSILRSSADNNTWLKIKFSFLLLHFVSLEIRSVIHSLRHHKWRSETVLCFSPHHILISCISSDGEKSMCSWFSVGFSAQALHLPQIPGTDAIRWVTLLSRSVQDAVFYVELDAFIALAVPPPVLKPVLSTGGLDESWSSISPTVWICVGLVASGSVLVLLLWFIIYRRHSRTSQSTGKVQDCITHFHYESFSECYFFPSQWTRKTLTANQNPFNFKELHIRNFLLTTSEVIIRINLSQKCLLSERIWILLPISWGNLNKA